MIPKVAPVVVVQYSAKYVARCIEYEGHTDQRGYWRALKKEWKRVVKLRAFWLFDSVSTYEQRVEKAKSGTGYWWFKHDAEAPWDYSYYFPQGGVDPTEPPMGVASTQRIQCH